MKRITTDGGVFASRGDRIGDFLIYYNVYPNRNKYSYRYIKIMTMEKKAKKGVTVVAPYVRERENE